MLIQYCELNEGYIMHMGDPITWIGIEIESPVALEIEWRTEEAKKFY